jgi:hypothetical protein
VKDFTKSLFLSSLLVLQTSPGLYAQEPAPKPAVPAAVATASTATPGSTTADVPNGKVVLAEGTDVPLSFDQDLSSKTAAEGDPVVLILAEDLKVGNVVVAKAGARAVGEVTNAKKSGMMGKAGELNIRVDYLKVGEAKVHLRGTKGKEGQSGTTSAIVLTVLFGPIGLIKHGKNIEIKKGTALKVYVSDDISLPPTV